MENFLVFFLIFFSAAAAYVLPADPVNLRGNKEQAIARRLLNSSRYNTGRRPEMPDNKAVNVHVQFHIVSFGTVNDYLMEFSAQFRLVQKWSDFRLSFPTENIDTIHLASDQKIWIPDTFFQTEKSGHVHQIDQPNIAVMIGKDGSVMYSKRLSMAFSCPMNLVMYPHDTQRCDIDFASYAYTTDDIEYTWSNEPVTMNENAMSFLPKFQVRTIRNESCTSTTNTGTYSCLRIRISLSRVYTFFLLQLYIPSCMLVGVSCVSFWIDWRSAPARVPLAIVTLLSMSTQSHGINAALPPVSYTKAIDVWIGACISFIFAALIEYAFVNYIGVKEQRRKNDQQATPTTIPSEFTNGLALRNRAIKVF